MKEYRFTAIIQPADHRHGFVFFPFDAQEEFGTRGHVRVKATFDGVPYAGSLVKYAAPQHMLPIVKAILQQIGKCPGDTVSVFLERDETEPALEVPTELAKAMKAAGVFATFESLSYTHRKEYCRWITDAKKAETRNTRIVKSVEMLRKGVKTPG